MPENRSRATRTSSSGQRRATGGKVVSGTASKSSKKTTQSTRAKVPVTAKTQRRPDTRPLSVHKRTYKPVKRIKLSSSTGRLKWSWRWFAVLLAIISMRLIWLQVFDFNSYAQIADQQSFRIGTLPAQRGAITDRNGQILAATEPAVDIFCDPTVIRGDRESKAYQEGWVARLNTLSVLLSRHLGGTASDYLGILTEADTQKSSIRKEVPASIYRDIANELWEAGLSGIYKETNPVRTYPAAGLAGNIVGFINKEDKASAGLELTFDKMLRGTDGEEAYDTSRYGRIPVGANVVKPAIDGINVHTTIDGDLQATVEVAVNQAVSAAGAESGFGIVMNVNNGEVLALASSPSYDPNRYEQYKQENLGVKAVSDAYEPGSVQKVLTLAAATDLGIITPETQLNIPEKLSSGGYSITDLHEHSPHLNARGVLVESSNIGTALIERKMSREQYFDYMNRFGLGNKTGIQLPGEGSGLVDSNMTEAQRDRASFGQSISVTGIQEAAAIASIANGGVWNPPTIIRSFTDNQGRQVTLKDDRAPRRVVSEQTADMVMNMMENVVIDDNYKLLPISGYRLAGKTGTAERFEPSCGCYRGNTTSFVGIGTAENPSLLVYVVVDKPTAGEPSGYLQAGPAVSDIMKLALPRYGVPLSTQPAQKDPKTW
ncbi:MAG: peptidoglycan D,D-transpeptidase FtsI family protein [Propionibacteriaceae bacterium]